MIAPAFDLSTIKLESGSHTSPDAGACAMEWVSILAGEAFGADPKCTSPVLAAYVIKLNDVWDDKQRQKLIPYLPRLIGTRGDLDTDVKRAYLAADAAVRVFAPLALRTAGLTEEAAKLEALPEIVSQATAASAWSAAESAAAAWSARSAAESAAAAWSAAWSAAAAWSARSAAESAAAAWSAAWSARSAAWSAEALDLLDRMIGVGKAA